MRAIRGGARDWAYTLCHKHERGTVKNFWYPDVTVSVLESVARAHLLTAALMPAEPHIRSPFSERLAPQSLILEVIGLGRAGPHCIAASIRRWSAVAVSPRGLRARGDRCRGHLSPQAAARVSG